MFNNLNESLKTFKPDIVYISKINSLHFKYAKIILKKGYNTIVDKPITLDLQKTKELINIAKLKKVLLAEATLFNYHRFIKTLNKICKTPKNIEHIYSVFNIPMPKSLNQISKTKGDCESDMAPYAASIIRLYLGKRNIRINVSKNYFKKTKIVKNFYIMASSNKKTYFGNFAFGKEYIQKIIFYTKEKIVYSPEKNFCTSTRNEW